MTAFCLPPRDLLVRTNDEDPLDYYYHPLTGWAYRRRLTLALDALGAGPYPCLLEIGYGSGILLPELARRCGRLHALDTHREHAGVERLLRAGGLSAELAVGSILELPYPDASFDALVCLSVLEHMDESTLPRSLLEVRRVCRKGARVVLGFPVRNVATDAFYGILGYSPRDMHPSSHRDIRRAAASTFPSVAARRWPAFLPEDLSLYVILQGTV